MFSRIQQLTVLFALPLFVSATVLPRQFGSDIGNGCNTGPIQCCTKVESVATSPYSDIVGGLLGVAIGSLAGLIGTNCSPIDVVGLGGGNSCNVQPVCCTGTQFNGLISFGCNPVTINV
ncbi:hydrophobin-251 [Panaeolus papilionaceus]|nr:hydrophobin-251 [Panaeolus papilionaceus]